MKHQVLSSVVAGAMTLALSSSSPTISNPGVRLRSRPRTRRRRRCSRRPVRTRRRFKRRSITSAPRSAASTTATIAGPLDSGRREINWDGGGSATSPVGPRRSRLPRQPRRPLHHARHGLRAGAAVDGLATTFDNPSTTRPSSRRSARCASSVAISEQRAPTSRFFVPGAATSPRCTTAASARSSPTSTSPMARPRLSTTTPSRARWSSSTTCTVSCSTTSVVPPSPGDAQPLVLRRRLSDDARIATSHDRTAGDVTPVRTTTDATTSSSWTTSSSASRGRGSRARDAPQQRERTEFTVLTTETRSARETHGGCHTAWTRAKTDGSSRLGHRSLDRSV